MTALVLAMLAASLPVARVAAADEEASPSPILLINVASVDRWIENTNFLFQMIERGEIGTAAEGQLARVNDLKGLDRTKPLGVMLFLEGFQLRGVMYLPVTNVDDLAKTLSIGPVVAKKVEGKDDRYELTGGPRTQYVRILNGHAYVSDQAELLDGELSDPAEATKAVASRYDLSVTANLDRVPEATRQTFLTILRSAGEAQLQQRDNESRAAYLVRRASGMNNMQLLEQVLTHGRSLTLGWDVSPQNKRAVLELALDVRPDSEFAQYLEKVGSKPSLFRGLLNDSAPMAFSISWAMDASRKKMFLDVLKAAKEGNTPQKTEDAADVKPPALERVFDQLIATAETGHLDAFVQMAATESGKLVIGGGLKVADAEAMAAALGELVQSLRDNSDFKEVTPDATLHAGVSLHRLVPKQVRSAERAVYGEDASVLLGAGAQAVWFSFGNVEGGAALKRMIDGVADKDRIVPQDSTAPLRMVINVNQWMALSGRREGDADDGGGAGADGAAGAEAGGGTETPRAEGDAPADGQRRPRRGGAFREVARQALNGDNDAIRVDFRPTENGGRLRVEFDEGFLRMIGLGIARQYDRSQL